MKMIQNDVEPIQAIEQLETVNRPVSPLKNFIERFSQHLLAVIGTVVLAIICLFAVIGPMISGHVGSDQTLTAANLAPSSDYWFGTDDLGRDVFTRVWLGARISLGIGLIAALIDVVLGVLIGCISGYAAGRGKWGNRLDQVIMRVVEILYGIPYLLVVILLLVLMKPGIITMIIALSITGWVNMARMVRGQVLQIKSEPFVVAGEMLGTSHLKIMWKHILPNIMGVVIVSLTFTIPSAIFAESFLSFLGLGIQAPSASWGTMANDALGVILSGEWWRLFFPSLLIALTMFAFNVIGDGLQDTFNPESER